MWSRSAHRVPLIAFVCAAEDVGFEVRDSIVWLYGSAFPKSYNVGRALGGRWAGWGTALKPLHEPILLARKPLTGTVAANVNEYGTGALNIDACRLPDGNRWPANAVLDEYVAKLLNAEAGERSAGAHPARRGGLGSSRTLPSTSRGTEALERVSTGAGGASRFFYVPKPSASEREAGLLPGGGRHPTVKPVELMRQLCRLVTPPGGVILDPFAGTATTGCAAAVENIETGTEWAFIGIERDARYLPLAHARLLHWATDATPAGPRNQRGPLAAAPKEARSGRRRWWSRASQSGEARKPAGQRP